MAKTNLTVERLKELFHYYSNAGIFVRIFKSSGRLAKRTIAGGLIPTGYRILRIDGRNYYAHRLAWLYMTGEQPKGDIDHIDGARDNNAFGNLREATRAQNLQNQRHAKAGNTSGVLGVSWVKGRDKWLAQITYGGKQHNLGHYDTIEQAQAAYLAAKRKHHGFCTI